VIDGYQGVGLGLAKIHVEDFTGTAGHGG